MIYVAAVCLLTLLGVAYVKLYDVVKAHQPEALPRFYLIMTVIRMILVVSLAGIVMQSLPDGLTFPVRMSLTALPPSSPG